MSESLVVPVTEPTQAGEARRMAAMLATRAALDETDQGRVALIVTEMANNLAHHADGGELILRPLDPGPSAGLELLAIDRGPGMADVRRCMTDGYSSGSTLGQGLGAIRRQSDEFDLISHPGQGTALLSRVWGGPKSEGRPTSAFDIGAVCRPLPGETECGDAWLVREAADGCTVVMVADGLGHGPPAAAAARAAIESFRDATGSGPSDLLRLAHGAMRATRGGAVAVAAIDPRRRELRYCGVGNIAGTILGPAGRSGLVSHNGILGAEARKFQEFLVPWPAGSLLVMHSDGLSAQWRLDRAAPVASRHPALVAGTLYRDHARGRDDATVVVVRDHGGAGS